MKKELVLYLYGDLCKRKEVQDRGSNKLKVERKMNTTVPHAEPLKADDFKSFLFC